MKVETSIAALSTILENKTREKIKLNAVRNRRIVKKVELGTEVVLSGKWWT